MVLVWIIEKLEELNKRTILMEAEHVSQQRSGPLSAHSSLLIGPNNNL